MQRSTALTRWLIAIFMLLVCALPSHAQEEEDLDAAASSMARVDEAFGDYLVNPILAVLFFDIYPFDNSISGDEARPMIHSAPKLDVKLQKMEAGEPVFGEVIEPGEDAQQALIAHELLRRDELRALNVDATPTLSLYTGAEETPWLDVHFARIADTIPAFDAPVTMTLGGVNVAVTSTSAGLTGTATGGTVNLQALGIVPEPAPSAEEAARLTVEVPDVPFPIEVTSDGAVIGGSGAMPASTVPVVAGMSIYTSAGETAQVLATGPNGAAVGIATARADLDAIPNPRDLKVPLVVAWLVLGAVFFTFRLVFVNVRMFGHALAVVTGKYDNEDDPGEISSFQALASALSATVGLGNIAGVAIAVGTGGPGAVFWMVLAGALGMSSKFVECTLGQMYRQTDAAGVVSGGPMYYLSRGITELGERLGGSRGRTGGMAIGYPLGALFAVMCIGASFGGGNMFQANQSFAALSGIITTIAPSMADPNTMFYLSLAYGLILATLVGIVIIGGIKRIGVAAGVIVPLMCGVYLLAGVGVLAINYAAVPAALYTIVSNAFTPTAGLGGLMGVLVVGFQRAAFSNEAGVGSASIAHSAASTPEPVREGVVALLEPFIDTILVCTMTGLVVVVSGAYLQDTGDGVLMTSYAFSTVFSWFPYVLTLAVVLFAFSTMISWSYYGERATVWLFGDWARYPYKALFVVFVVFGSIFELGNVLTFSDLMVLGMALPNIAGAVLLSGHVARALKQYRQRLADGSFDT